MRKLYSLVLMATALLIGTNAWANYPANWLQEQFDAVQPGGQVPTTITMEDDIVLTDPVYLGTKNVDDPRKSIILDMNGHHITMDADTWLASHPDVYCHIFTITHGELLVRNNASDRATNPSLIQMTGTGYGKYNDIFTVAGSYKSSRWVKNGNDYVIDVNAAKNTRKEGWFTHLEIGEGVKLVAGNEIYGSGISMDGYYTNNRALVSSAESFVSGATGTFGSTGLNGGKANICLYGRSDAPAYNTTLLSSSTGEGVAYGLRVDVYGDIEFASDAEAGKTYGIKINGGIKSSLKENEIFLNTYCWPMDQAYAKTYADAAAPVAKQGKTPAQNQTYTITGTYYENHKLDTIDAPFLYVHSTAHIVTAAEAEEATAVYCSGYGKTLIEGECKGKSGVNIKSGTVELHDAVIESTATTYTETEGGNHATGTGGVIVNSVNGRAGGIEVVISGDTKVSTTKGYAIEEVVNKTDDTGTEVSSIKIQGGTIEGGDKGAIAISSETKEDESAAVSVTGGNVQGGATVGKQTVDISTLFPNTQQYHTTEVTVNGKPTVIVSEGPAPSAQNTGNWETISAKTGQNVVWNEIEEASIGENKTVTLGELQIIPASAGQTLTIANKATLKVDHLIMNDYARIIVEAGGKLIVEGEQGIVAPKVDNIVLKANATSHATFLFNPAVTSNKHPNATVEYVSNSFVDDASHYQWERVGIPTWKQLTAIEVTCRTAVAVFENNGWTQLGFVYAGGTPEFTNIDKLNKPFVTYNMISYRTQSENKATYTFKGELVGNTDAALSADREWNGYPNSYMADVNAGALLSGLASATNIDKTIYLPHYQGNGYYTWDPVDAEWVASEKIAPMQAFILRNNSTETEVTTLNYKNTVWNPGTGAVGAPRRFAKANDNTAKLRIVVTNENGVWDNVKMTESATNNHNAVKYMNDDVNIYAMADEKIAIAAAEDLENTYVGFSTVKGGNFTISFANVEGREFTLVDHATGARVVIAEGNTYEFTADANSANDYRFEIVGRQNMPTAIDNTEAVKSVKGVYTITGQYVGEMNVWNTLPAGVYVVNGEKRVK